MTHAELEEYVAECERKIKALDERVAHLESRVEATIAIATRDAIAATSERIRSGLVDRLD